MFNLVCFGIFVCSSFGQTLVIIYFHVPQLFKKRSKNFIKLIKFSSFPIIVNPMSLAY
jgi:hypothetical protein